MGSSIFPSTSPQSLRETAQLSTKQPSPELHLDVYHASYSGERQIGEEDITWKGRIIAGYLGHTLASRTAQAVDKADHGEVIMS